MRLHAYTDANKVRAGYYISETEEMYSEIYSNGMWDYAYNNTTFGELVAVRLLLQNKSIQYATGLTVFTDSSPVTDVLNNKTRFKKKESEIQKEFEKILQLQAFIPYKPRFIWIRSNKNIADKTLIGKRPKLSNNQSQSKFNPDGSWKYSASKSHYLLSQQAGR